MSKEKNEISLSERVEDFVNVNVDFSPNHAFLDDDSVTLPSGYSDNDPQFLSILTPDVDLVKVLEVGREDSHPAIPTGLVDLDHVNVVKADAASIAGELRRIRVGMNRSRAELSKSLDVPQSSVYQIEEGSSSPTLKRLSKYSSALGYTISLILSKQQAISGENLIDNPTSIVNVKADFDGNFVFQNDHIILPKPFSDDDVSYLQVLTPDVTVEREERTVDAKPTNTRSVSVAIVEDEDCVFRASATASSVGQMLKKLRDSLGLSKADAALRAEIPHSNVYQLEKGLHSPTLSRVQKYSSKLGFNLFVEFKKNGD